MWIRCNPNPVGRETGDCVIRAVAVATGQSWRETYWDLCEQGAIMGDLPNNNSVWGAYLRSRGGKQFLLPESCPEITSGISGIPQISPETVNIARLLSIISILSPIIF